MSPAPLAAVQNAIEHYRIDEILISTLAGEQSKWLEEGLIDDVRGAHRQAGRARRGRRGEPPPRRSPSRAAAEPAAEGSELMESASSATVEHAHEHHGPPRRTQSSRIDRQTLGILLFIVSEVMLFGAFFASYFFLRVVANVGPWPPDGLRPPEGGRRRQHGDPDLLELHGPLGARVDPAAATAAGMIIGLGATWLLGFTFLFIQLNEYVHIGFSARDGRLRLDLLRPDRPPRRPRDGGADPAGVRQHPRLARPLHVGAEEAPRRRGARASTGTSSTSCGSSSSRPSTSSSSAPSHRHRGPSRPAPAGRVVPLALRGRARGGVCRTLSWLLAPTRGQSRIVLAWLPRPIKAQRSAKAPGWRLSPA